MKRILLVVVMIAVATVSASAMSKSRVRRETRFLTDKMAYELKLSNAQYNDVYEINYDFINSVRHIMDEVTYGYRWALDDYYDYLDIRNEDLRWVLNRWQYREFLGIAHFYRPIYVDRGGCWQFRVYVVYPNPRLFYFPRPYHYVSYHGQHYCHGWHGHSYYKGRYTHQHADHPHYVRQTSVYHSNRRSDFGSVQERRGTSRRPEGVLSPSARRQSAQQQQPEKVTSTSRRSSSGQSSATLGRPSVNRSKPVGSNTSVGNSSRRQSAAGTRPEIKGINRHTSRPQVSSTTSSRRSNSQYKSGTGESRRSSSRRDSTRR